MTKIRKRFKENSSVIIDNELGSGFFLTRRYVGYIREEMSGRGNAIIKVYLVTTPNLYKRLLDANGETQLDEVVVDDTPSMTLWERSGSFFDLSYSRRKLPFGFHAKPNQAHIIERIKELYSSHHNPCIMLHGMAGKGKSMIGRLLAVHYGGHYCDTWNPSDAGDEIGTLYNSISPTKSEPLILVLDEFDTIITKAHRGEIEKHKYIPVPIRNKTGWNQFLDRFALGSWPYVILLIISNRSPEWVNGLDPSYIRRGRVSDIIEVV